MPPAFNLSQDQTLQFNLCLKLAAGINEEAVSHFLFYFQCKHFICFELPDFEKSGSATNQAPAPIGCSIFKEHHCVTSCSEGCAFYRFKTARQALFSTGDSFSIRLKNNPHPPSQHHLRPLAPTASGSEGCAFYGSTDPCQAILSFRPQMQTEVLFLREASCAAPSAAPR